MNTQRIIEKALARQELGEAELIALLALPRHHAHRYQAMAAANHLTRTLAPDEGIVAGQIGLNVEPCPVDCAFCSYAMSTTCIEHGYVLTELQVRDKTRRFVQAGANFISLMATADFPWEDFYRLSKAARQEMPDDMMLSANVGDFGPEQARMMRQLGYGRVYHVVRLGEGIVTNATIEERIDSIKAAAAEGLEIAFCIEPVGPEHTPEELAERMVMSRQFSPTACAVMRRIPLKGSHYEGTGIVSEMDMALIMATMRLAHAHTETQTFYIHEPSLAGLVAGANQICAEDAANPRELEEDGDSHRGWTVERCHALLAEADFAIRKAPNYPGSWYTRKRVTTSCC